MLVVGNQATINEHEQNTVSTYVCLRRLICPGNIGMYNTFTPTDTRVTLTLCSS